MCRYNRISTFKPSTARRIVGSVSCTAGRVRPLSHRGRGLRGRSPAPRRPVRGPVASFYTPHGVPPATSRPRPAPARQRQAATSASGAATSAPTTRPDGSLI